MHSERHSNRSDSELNYMYAANLIGSKVQITFRNSARPNGKRHSTSSDAAACGQRARAVRTTYDTKFIRLTFPIDYHAKRSLRQYVQSPTFFYVTRNTDAARMSYRLVVADVIVCLFCKQQ